MFIINKKKAKVNNKTPHKIVQEERQYKDKFNKSPLDLLQYILYTINCYNNYNVRIIKLGTTFVTSKYECSNIIYSQENNLQCQQVPFKVDPNISCESCGPIPLKKPEYNSYGPIPLINPQVKPIDTNHTRYCLTLG